MSERLDASLIISIGTSIALIISLVYTHKNYSKEREKTYAEILMRISSDYLKITTDLTNVKELNQLINLIYSFEELMHIKLNSHKICGHKYFYN